jgi:hypothetical protein
MLLKILSKCNQNITSFHGKIEIQKYFKYIKTICFKILSKISLNLLKLDVIHYYITIVNQGKITTKTTTRGKIVRAFLSFYIIFNAVNTM